MSDFMKRMSNHPGVPIACMMTATFVVTEMHRQDGLWFVGMVPSVVVWVIVLVTAIAQPLQKGEGDE